MSGDDPKKIVEFPKAELPPEERACRLKIEAERLARLPAVEWLFYVESGGVAEKHGVSRAVLKEMVETTIRANCTVILRTSAAWQHIINNQALSRANDAERECRIHNARAPPDPEKGKAPRPTQRGAVVSRSSSTGVIYMNKPSPQAVPEPEGETQGAAVTTTQLDPFSPANLRLSQSFTETVRVEKLLTTVPVRKPGPQDFVRVHPAAEYREHFPMVELRDEREEYIVTAGLVAELAGEFVTKTLHTAINRQGIVFFWPVRLPSSDGRDMNWWKSAREAAALATREWDSR